MKFIQRCILCNSQLVEDTDYLLESSSAELVLVCPKIASKIIIDDYYSIWEDDKFQPHYCEYYYSYNELYNSFFLCEAISFAIDNCEISFYPEQSNYGIYFYNIDLGGCLRFTKSPLNIPLYGNEIRSQKDLEKFYKKICKLGLLI